MEQMTRRRRETDDLAGGDEPIKRPRGRPRKVAVEKTSDKEVVDEFDGASPDLSYRAVYTIKQGVPVRWLALVFGHTEHNVKRRLKDLRPVDVGAHGNPLYAVVDAAPYLVEPKIDLKEFLLSIRDDDLPDDLRLKLWNARRQRNRVLQEEGELWHSSVVVEKFAQVLLNIREKLQLIPEKVGRMNGISPEQYKLIRAVVDSVQDDMHRTIMEMADNDNTPSVLGGDEDEVVL